jgi:RNA polymerase sigma-70 factor (ECF subfamily)
LAAEAVLHRIASGDKGAAEECLKLYGGLVWSLARRMSPDREDAEDAVQEIFIDVWKNAARFDAAQASETTFIAMIARRRLIDRLRKRNRQPATDSIEDVSVEPEDRADRVLQTSVEAGEAARAMRQLRREQQQVLKLSIFQGLSHQEISNLTGMPVGTVKTHARRGLLQIREILGIGKKTGEGAAQAS